MAKNIKEINEKIKIGQVVVLNAEKLTGYDTENGKIEDVRKIDAVTTATFGPMCLSGLAGKVLKMKALVMYDSTYGNTKTIAQTIAKEIGEGAEAVFVPDFNMKELKGIDLIIAGSPIIGWRPSKKMSDFLSGLNNEQLKGIKAAAFDTRIKTFASGDAAKKISKELQRASAEIIIEPRAFYVKDSEGPLLDGEVEKAAEWARAIMAKVS